MKRALAIVLDYFVILTAACIAGILIYTAFFNCTTLIAGETVRFTKEIIIYGFFETFPAVLLLMTLILIIYKIRHKGSPAASVITYVILVSFTWFWLYPLSLIFEGRFYSRFLSPEQVQSMQDLSSGYFRSNGGNVYYFIDNADSDARCLTVYNADGSEPRFENIDVSPLSDFAKNALPFREPLIKDAMDGIPHKVMRVFDSIKMRAQLSWRSGYVSWIMFCSLGFVLASVYIFIRVSEWRLVNSLITITLYVFIIAFNAAYFLPQFDFIRESANVLIIGTRLQKWFIDLNQDFLLTCLNTVSAFSIITVGAVVNFIKDKD
ncbi:MAG: hypothetical protein ACTTKL_09340 [Treponema sp.]